MPQANQSIRGGRPGWPEAQSQGSLSAYDEAFKQAYQTYYSRVFAFIYSRAGNVEVAKDLTAEAFEKAYLKGHDLREAAAYSTWLFMIARNVVIGHFRRRKREAACVNRVRESVWLGQRAPDPEERALQTEMLDRLRAHLRTLSERDQELLALKFEADLTYAEIGQVLNMGEVNVRVSTFRALNRLREKMKEVGNECRPARS